MLISWLWERITDVSTLTEVPSNTLLARILEEISSTLRTLTLEVAVPAVVATLWMYSFSTSMNSTLDIGKVTVIITVSESEQDVKLVFSWSPEPDSKDEFIKMTSKWGQECKTVFLQENLFKITWKVPRRTRKASSCSCKIHSNNWDKLEQIFIKSITYFKGTSTKYLPESIQYPIYFYFSWSLLFHSCRLSTEKLKVNPNPNP